MSDTSHEPPGISHAERATLKQIALAGAPDRTVEVTRDGLADTLEVSPQTVSRTLRRLAGAGLVERTDRADGLRVALTESGLIELRREYEDYRRLFEAPESIALRGVVATGMGEGRYFVALPGYKRQFVDRLGYEPFEGTLNVDLTPESVRRRCAIEHMASIPIDGWEDDERTYGPAECYPVTVETADERTYDTAHVVVPERTHHDADQLELLAPDRLRDRLSLDAGDQVTIHVEEH
jgi:riboflavin kinase